LQDEDAEWKRKRKAADYEREEDGRGESGDVIDLYSSTTTLYSR